MKKKKKHLNIFLPFKIGNNAFKAYSRLKSFLFQLNLTIF